MQHLELGELCGNGFWALVISHNGMELHACFRNKLKDRKIFQKYIAFQNSKAISKANSWYTEEGLGFHVRVRFECQL